MDYINFINDNIIRLEVSHRGGGVEIDCSELFGEGAKMTAYQNYLGGGMLGSINNDYNFNTSALSDEDAVKLEKLSSELRRFYYGQVYGDFDDDEEFQSIQSRPASAY